MSALDRYYFMAGLLLTSSSAMAWAPIDTCGSDYTHWAGNSVWQTTRVGAANYYSGLSDTEVYDAMFDGFQVWSDASCCSSYAHSYGGDTTAGYSSADSINAIEFYESSWPAWLGGVNSTIAVTLPQYSWTNCEIFNADEAYNAVGFTFTTTATPGWNDTDLQSITAHEHGHWIGLDHSSTLSATMYASYPGGTDARTLDADDETGACTLYPGNCGPTESVCDDGIDDDADGLVDCLDSDCANNPVCMCPATLVIGCDQVLNGDNGGGDNTVETWGCANWSTTGPESVYSFTSSITGDVTVRLTGLADDLDLFVTSDNGGSCDSNNCAASGTGGTADEEVTFAAYSGTTYEFVVDGYDGASSAFSLETDCGGVGGTTGTGTGTGTGAPAGVCAATSVLSCGTTVPGGNAGGSTDVDQFDCATWETTGPEQVLELTPSADGDVTVRLSGLTADVDLMVTTDLAGGCDANGCLGASQNYDLDPEEVVFFGQTGVTYMVVIDGYDGAVASYDIEADCPAPPPGTGTGTGTGTGGTTTTPGTGTGGSTAPGTGTGTGGPGTDGGAGTGTGTGGPDEGATLDDSPPIVEPGKGCSCSTSGGAVPVFGFLPLLALAARRRPAGSGPQVSRIAKF